MIKTASKTMIKDMNTALLLSQIRGSGPISRADLAKKTGLTAATVSSNTADLLNWKYVREIGEGASSGGRKPTMLELDPDSLGVVAIEIGTSGSRAAIVDLGGRIRADERIVHEDPTIRPGELLPRLFRAIDRLRERPPGNAMTLLGIGTGVHGIVDSEQGISIFAPVLHWENEPLKPLFEQYSPLPFRMDNDVRAMALGEKLFGQAGESNNFVFLNVDVGIGSGIFVNGEMISGSGYGAGEIGHIFIEDNGVECFCGRRGCLSTFASGAALRAITSRRFRRPMTGSELREAADRGDAQAQSLIRETGEYIGRALSIMVNILNPEQIIIGGEMSVSGTWFFEGVKAELNAKAMSNNVKDIRVLPAINPDDSGIVGAASLILKQVFQSPSHFIA